MPPTTISLPTEAFASLEPIDGYLPLEDHGLIGDGESAALVARDGAVSWLCVPRFDASPLFCRLLDVRRGGAFRVAPVDLVESRQAYVPDSGVLATEMRSRSGTVRVTDALTFRSGADLAEGTRAARGELLRCIRVLDGRVRLQIDVEPRGGGEAHRRADGWRIGSPFHPEMNLQLHATRPLDGRHTVCELTPEEPLNLILRWGEGGGRYHPYSPEEVLEATLRVWRRWIRCFHYEGPQEELVRRSAITLKMLDHTPNGAIVAAPTSSLPETIGGVRNWDYRYTWVRDAAFSVYALRRIGLTQEAAAFLAWVLDVAESDERPKVLYDLQGKQPAAEREDPELEGYRRSHPVRWGNAAADQRQHDVFGEILDCAYQWARNEAINERLWQRLQEYIRSAGEEWRRPDHGIWEVRTSGQPFTYSAALCHVALDRGARLAERFGLPGDVAAWRSEAGRIVQTILEEAWDPRRNSLTESLSSDGGLDASLLTLPLRRVVPADHPRMVATTAAVMRHLGAGSGLLYRYLPEESPDGLPGHEGAFLLCSFWYVDNLARQGRLDEAMELYDSLCARAGVLGLLPEQIDPTSGAFLGNYPQAFSHVGLISSGVNLARRVQAAGT